MKEALQNKPLIIFSQSADDGEWLSLLLSDHLRPAEEGRLQDKPHTEEENYYTNEFLIRILENASGKTPSISLYAQLHLLMEEGFDTKRLYGLSLPFQLFSAKGIETHFAQAKILFVYNEFENEEDNTIDTFKEILSFTQKNSHECFVLNSKFLITDPLMVAEQISGFTGFSVTNPETIESQDILEIEQLKTDQPGQLTREDRLQFFQLDYIAKHNSWIAGNDVLFIFHDISLDKRISLINRLRDLYCSFLFPVRCILICNDQETFASIKETLNGAFIFSGTIECKIKEDSLARQLNEIIESSDRYAVCVDNLNTIYSFSTFLPENRTSESMLVFCKVSIEDKVRKAALSDVLLKDYPEHSLMFSKQAWNKIKGFDTAVDDGYLLWDYAIRSLAAYDQEAFVLPASFNTLSIEKDVSVFAKEDSVAYKKVLVKHRTILEGCLDEVIRLASQENLSSHKENVVLYEKIASLQMISSHAKDELKSLQQLTSQLHLRIQYLENNWYQKLRMKVGKIKKIFFKKKSPGTGSLKRILQFIRFAFSKAGFGIVRKVAANVFKRLYILFEKRPVEIVFTDAAGNRDIFTYNDWVKKKLDKDDLLTEYEAYEESMAFKPKISIIMPVYNAPIRYLKLAIESVINQLYPNWELCIADDCSTDKRVQKLLHVYSVKDKRIKVHYRTENGHISATSNDALALTTGEFVLLMDHDDLITQNCLWEMVKTLNEKPETDILYSDEDKIEERYHKNAHFKPDWAPDHLLSRNYLGHVTVLRKSLMDTIGGFRLGFEGSQDYDLMLRATEQTTNIVHIPKVLYHWRIHQLSAAQGEDVKPYAYVAAKKALEEALVRRGLKGTVKYLTGLRGYKIDYAVTRNDLVSIIIPTKDQTALLKNTIDSIIAITEYTNYEIIVLNNNSTSNEFYAWVDEYTKKYPQLMQVVEAHFPFNFSKLMNIGAGLAKGEHLLLLNNDVEIIHADWLEIMVSYAQQKRIGAVGVKLLYPDDTVQHAGVIVGLGGIAGHSFVGSYKDDPGYFNYIQSVNNNSAVTAACLMCRKEVFDTVGGMDETFEVEYNDVDFCLKIMEAGYNNVYLPQVELYHYESATRGHPHQSKPSYERHLKEMKLFKDKWQHVIDHDPFYNPNLNLGSHDFSMNFSA
jgi:glycosyltransferase involved in cell wall biosynthesis